MSEIASTSSEISLNKHGLEHGLFLNRLEVALEQKRMSRRGLAKALDVSASGINAYWSKKSEPSRSMLIEISRELDVSLDWLATGNGAMRRGGFDCLDPDAAEAAMLAIADTVRDTKHKLSDNSLKVLFEDFYRGFLEAGRTDDE